MYWAAYAKKSLSTFRQTIQGAAILVHGDIAFSQHERCRFDALCGLEYIIFIPLHRRHP